MYSNVVIHEKNSYPIFKSVRGKKLYNISFFWLDKNEKKSTFQMQLPQSWKSILSWPSFDQGKEDMGIAWCEGQSKVWSSFCKKSIEFKKKYFSKCHSQINAIK